MKTSNDTIGRRRASSSTSTVTTTAANTRPLISSARIDAAIVDEIASLNKVLSIQSTDNQRYQQHIKVLDTEIDALKVIINDKQIIINKKDETIYWKDDDIKALQQQLAEALIHKSAFKIMEVQNKEIHNRLIIKQGECDKLQEQLDSVTANLIDTEMHASKKIKESIATEVNLTATIAELKHTSTKASLESLEKSKDALINERKATDLQKKLKLSEDMRIEQYNRTRTSEYKTLQKIDDVSTKLYNTIDEKNKIQESFELSKYHADLLQSQLDVTVEDSNRSEEMLKEMIDDGVDRYAVARAREKMLGMHNENMQLKLQLTQKAFNDLLRRYNRLDSIVKHAQNNSNDFSIKDMSKGNSSKKGSSNSSSSSSSRMNSDVIETVYDIQHDNSHMLLHQSMHKNTSVSNHIANEYEYNSIKASANNAANGALPRLTKSSSSSSKSNNYSNSTGATHEVITITTNVQHEKAKKRVLIKYLQLYCKQPHGDAKVFDLSNCAVTDSDMIEVIEHLRMLPSLMGIDTVNISSNLITAASVVGIVAYIIALPIQEYTTRKAAMAPLSFDFRNNVIDRKAASTIVGMIKRGNSISGNSTDAVMLTTFYDSDLCDVLIYASTTAVDDRPSVVIKIHLPTHNSSNTGGSRSSSSSNSSNSSNSSSNSSSHGILDIMPVVVDIDRTDVDLLIQKHLDVYPRCNLFNKAI